jgi:hypothetical protein
MTRGESGIIYCFSKKDAETVASELQHWSGDIIKVNVIGFVEADIRLEYITPVLLTTRKSESISNGGRARSSEEPRTLRGLPELTHQLHLRHHSFRSWHRQG